MVADRKDAPITAEAPAVTEARRNGPAALPPMTRWVCDGRAKDGGPCGQVLMELRLGEQGQVRIRCPKCGTWHMRGV
jgi:hypothetical protein